MKPDSKIFAGAVLLLAASVASAGVSTLAWYTTTRSVTLTMTSIHIVNNAGELDARIHAFSKGTVDSFHTTLSSENSYASDVSSKDGVHFYSPNWVDSDLLKANYIEDVTWNYKNYSDFVVSITNTGVDPIRVFLGENTALVPEDNEPSRAFATFARVALTSIAPLDVDNVEQAEVLAGTTELFFERKTSLGSYTKASLTSYVDDTCVNSDGEVSSKTLPEDLKHLYQEDLQAINSLTPNTSDQYLFTLPGGETRYYYGSIWLEGTAGNSDPALGGKVTLSLVFRATDEI